MDPRERITASADQAQGRTTVPAAENRESDHVLSRVEAARIVVVALAAAAVWFHVREPLTRVSLIGVLGVLIGGWPIFKEAAENAAARRMTMELSMSIAIIAAAGISQFFTALVITLFVLVAEVLEGMTVSRGRRAIRDLLDFLPRAVSVRRAGSISEVDADTLSVGDAVLVNPGGRIPVDGTVIAGQSFVDQAHITGESMPLEKTVGAAVFAGSINQSGALEIRAERIGRDTSYGKIIEAVEQAERSRAPVQRLADRLAAYLVYFALGAAVLTYLLTRDSRSTISVIIVAGACGIAAGTPLAILGGIGRAARAGAIVKGGLYLEKLAEVDTILLDKTGTLTFGTPEVSNLHVAQEGFEAYLLRTAAIAESRSEHPMAKAILRKARQLGVSYKDPDAFEYTPGKGVSASCEGDSTLVGSRQFLQEHGLALPHEHSGSVDGEVYVARGEKFLGSLVVEDTLRPEAKEVIRSLKAMGLRTILLTGDAQRVADDVGKRLGVDKVAAELLPEEKLQYVTRLTGMHHIVAMVGDGVNDA